MLRATILDSSHNCVNKVTRCIKLNYIRLKGPRSDCWVKVRRAGINVGAAENKIKTVREYIMFACKQSDLDHSWVLLRSGYAVFTQKSRFGHEASTNFLVFYASCCLSERF